MPKVKKILLTLALVLPFLAGGAAWAYSAYVQPAAQVSQVRQNSTLLQAPVAAPTGNPGNLQNAINIQGGQ